MKESNKVSRGLEGKGREYLLAASCLLYGVVQIFVPLVLLVMGAFWVLNLLGETALLNSSDTLYASKNPLTGEVTVTKGCRADRLRPDGTCDKSITLDAVRRSFPFYGPGRP